LFSNKADMPYNQVNYAINDRMWDPSVFDTLDFTAG